MKKKLLSLAAACFAALAMALVVIPAAGDTAFAAVSFTELRTKIFTADIPYGESTFARDQFEQFDIWSPGEDVALTAGNYYKFTNTRAYPVQLKISNQFMYIDYCDSSGNTTSKPASSTLVNQGVIVAKGDTLYFKVTQNSSSASNDTITGNYYIANTRDTAYDEGSKGFTSKSSAGEIWYKKTFTEKTYFQVSVLNRYCNIYKNDSTVSLDDPSDGETSEAIIFDAGDTAYIKIAGQYGMPVTVSDKSYEYTQLTSISFPKDTYTVAKGGTISIAMDWKKENNDLDKDGAYDPYESKVEYFVDGSEYSYAYGTGEADNATTLDFTSNDTSLGVGKHTIKAVTSEGLTAETTVIVTPGAIPASSIKSVGTWKSSKISWATVYSGTGTSGYDVYLKNSSGTYVKKGSSTGSSYNLTGLSSNKTYYVKVVGYVTVDGVKYSDPSTSSAVKVLTASSTKPKITSLKSAGKKYYAKKWNSGYWTAAGNWVSGYWTSAHTNFYYKVKYSKVSGATTYQDNHTLTVKTGKGYMSVNGKKTSKKVSVKVRSVRKSGTSVAYGPWSTAKSVTVK